MKLIANYTKGCKAYTTYRNHTFIQSQRSRHTRGETVSRQSRQKIVITFILTVCCSSQRVSASGQFYTAELILTSTTKPLRRRLDQTQLLQMVDDVHPNPDLASEYPGDTGVKPLIKIQEPLYPELYHRA